MSTRRLSWEDLAQRQAGLVARRQLLRLGCSWDSVQAQLVARRWQAVSSTVLCTTTGSLTREQLRWAGVLHAGPGSAVGLLSALEVHGLQRWHRPEVTILLAKSHNVEPLDGVRFVETRRHVPSAASRHAGLPVWRVEPAALLFAAYEPVTRSAYGLLSAVVQQRLSTPDELERWIGRMRPLRRAKPFRRLLREMSGGVQSVAELDVGRMCRSFGLPAPRRQTRRRDRDGRVRYTDAEWLLRDGRVVVLEVDGAFHMDVEQWTDDIERERGLVSAGVVLLRCTALELRDDPARVAHDLRRTGVGESSA